MESSELLHFYLQGLRSLTGADSLSLFVPAPADAGARPLLVVEGEGPPLPEMESIESAQRFCSGLPKSAAHDGAPSVASAEARGRLIALPRLPAAWSDLLRPSSRPRRENGGAARRRHDRREPPLDERAWIGIRLGSETPWAERLLAEGGPWLLELAGRLAVHSDQVRRTLQDSVTGLPGRLGLQAILREELERGRGDEAPVSLLLLNPETFARVNQEHGAEVGDAVLKELADALVRQLRVTDAISRFGGAIFAAVLPGTPTEGALVGARRLLASLGDLRFAGGAISLAFRIGVATAEPSSRLGALDLIRRADQALNAAQVPGSERIRVWSSTGLEGATEEETAARILSTGDLGRDYRNMALLRDAIDIAAGSSDVDGLVAEVLDRLAWALKPELTALFVRGGDGNIVLMRSVERDPHRGTLLAGPGQVAPEHLAAAVECWESGRPAPLSRATEETLSWTVPVASAQGTLAVLLIAGRPDALHIGPEDLIFVRALSSQLALALDRARLSHEQERQRREQSRALRNHILDLEREIGRANLLYRSATMESLAAEASRVAPTDGTVLLVGESGTGKSLLARLLHAESPRATDGLTVVDCGALPPTQAEAELFGSVPDIYEAARHRDLGRLAEANLGTLYLADVGALPDAVQERLLSFLQDPYLELPDATRQRLDVRIIASALEVDGALDPRLSEELAARLAMCQLRVPPLRERTEDIGVLAEHFLAEVRRQYRRRDLSLSPGALQALEAHRWAGNVRELQNRILQGALQCESGALEAADMGLPGNEVAAVFSALARQTPREGLEECLDALAAAVRDQLDEVARHQAAPLPLGRWLSDDLLLEAHAAVSEVSRQGAARLGLAETTYRRRLEKAQEDVASGLSVRTGDWHIVRKILARLVRARGIEGEPLHALARRVLLRAILERYPSDERRAAGLFGVTVPTLRRRTAALKADRT
ncbi:MAG: sigma 54-interacting transcriptional regulator [Thermoanaerobaculia bacterium]